MRKLTHVTVIFIAVFSLTGCDVSVNKTVRVERGETRSGGINTVNGGIVIGEDAQVGGTCRTVNGSIDVEEKARVADLQTVNGGIDIGPDTEVNGDIETVNGSIRCDTGTTVDGNLVSINGSIKLYKSTVERDIKTYNGRISLVEQSRVKGDLIIEEPKGSGDRKPLLIRINDGSVVEGDVIVKDERRRVEIDLSGGGEIRGEVRGATILEE